jgi:hypothetical protein
MPMRKDFITETVEDIREQYESGVTTCPLFIFYLVPEGNPVWDKVSAQVELYAKYKKELDFYGIKSGVLLQSTIGHRPVAVPSTFQKYVGLYSGCTPEVCCPAGEGFRAYIRAATRRIASSHPAHIMVDDDFRLMGSRQDKGCACPLHMARMSALLGEEITREELYQTIDNGGENGEKYKELFAKTQIDSLIILFGKLSPSHK